MPVATDTAHPVHLGLLAALVIGLGGLLATAAPSRAQDSALTAIDIALEPDATMVQHAEAANAELLKVYPKGYALDATHRPHITMLQRFVKTEELDKVYAAIADVLSGAKPSDWSLEAIKYDYVIWDKAGLTVMLVKPTDQMVQFQQKLIDAVAPYTAQTGTAAAFFTSPGDAEINQPTIDYVTHYVPDSSGSKLQPHVTIGVAPPDFLKVWVAEPFDTFTFSPTAVSVYQLGNFGTARKKLHEWDLN